MDQTQTKIMTLKMLSCLHKKSTTFQIFRNQSNRLPERQETQPGITLTLRAN